jgi:hypothetical protein
MPGLLARGLWSERPSTSAKLNTLVGKERVQSRQHWPPLHLHLHVLCTDRLYSSCSDGCGHVGEASARSYKWHRLGRRQQPRRYPLMALRTQS